MSFKIVQEVQKRGYVLTIIPELFEENGVLWYPPSSWSTKKRNLIMKNPYAKPDKSTWTASRCLVKKRKLKSYEIAEQNEEELLGKNVTTATEDDNESDGQDEPTHHKRFKNPYVSRSPQQNFEDIVEECIENEQIVYLPNIASQKIFSIEEVQEIEESPKHLMDISNNYVTQHGNNSIMWHKVLKNQKTITKNQEILMEELKDVKVQLNSGLTKVFTQIENLMKGGWIESVKDSNPMQRSFSTCTFNKVATHEDAKTLDNALKSEHYMANMISQMAYLVGKGGNRCGDGWTCCYELIDSIFHRSFLAECSWTGASTSKEDGKIPFLSFKNILKFYSQIVMNADPNFSLATTQNFFKSLLRNSTRFLNQEASQIRKSSQRHRVKKCAKKGGAELQGAVLENEITEEPEVINAKDTTLELEKGTTTASNQLNN